VTFTGARMNTGSWIQGFRLLAATPTGALPDGACTASRSPDPPRNPAAERSVSAVVHPDSGVVPVADHLITEEGVGVHVGEPKSPISDWRLAAFGRTWEGLSPDREPPGIQRRAYITVTLSERWEPYGCGSRAASRVLVVSGMRGLVKGSAL